MNNTNITDHDRAQLAAKLDQELEQWMDTLEQKKYQDGWPEDRWQVFTHFYLLLTV